jgi:radical SAM superfamily enzyme YgiQ (UPF0313 family)
MRLYLINPSNPLVSLARVKHSRWNRYRIWKPLGLMVIAGLTPREWEIRILDENRVTPDYAQLPRPDLVGITAFTSQAPRAYQLADGFRANHIPVVMGGIHATMCPGEALEHVDSIVTGEAEAVWGQVLEDTRRGRLKKTYDGGNVDLAIVPSARQDLLTGRYAFGSIQTSRGCPLNCSFCSVTSFNGARYRHRPIENVIAEFRSIKEKYILFVDDNLIGTRKDHLERAKELFRAIIRTNIHKRWICQATVNMADDEELLCLAARAGCSGVFIGFESPTTQGLAEIGKKFNLTNERNFQDAVRRIQSHGILVTGSFIMGLDEDQPGIGKQIAQTATDYGLDFLNAMFLTPLPGTRLWDKMNVDERIAAGSFPEDWKYYTLTFPVARYKNISADRLLTEMETCDRTFYSIPKILHRLWGTVLTGRNAPIALVGNLSYRSNIGFSRKACSQFNSRAATKDSVIAKQEQ